MFSKWFVRVVLLCWLAIVATAGCAYADNGQSGRRIALVVGNSAYKALPKLKNAAGDAKLVADALGKVGFDVTLITDASLDAMNAAIDKMAEGAREDDHVVFYYSGHGFQLDGTNYIVPTDAVLTSKDVIDTRAIRLNQAITKLQSGGRQTMVFVDACRDNPLPPSVRGNQTVNGLAKLGDGVAQNLFVAFATSPGRVSLDGAGDHGPFATALARYLPQPDVPIYLMMTSVRTPVLADTNKGQMPAVEETLLAPFYFNGNPQQGLQFGEEDSPVAIPAGDGGPTPPPRGPSTLPPGESPPTTVAGAGIPTLVPTTAGPAIAGTELPQAPAGPAEPTGEGSGETHDKPPPIVVANTGSEGNPPLVPVAPDYTLLVQQHLKRLGCFPSLADGVWGDASRKALKRYADTRHAAALGVDPSEDIYNRLVKEPAAVCARQPATGIAVTGRGGQHHTSPTGGSTATDTQSTPPPDKPNGGGTIKKDFNPRVFF